MVIGDVYIHTDFARGVWSVCISNSINGSKGRAWEIINAIEHIETFKDTDQYLWMTVGRFTWYCRWFWFVTSSTKNLTLDELEYEDVGERHQLNKTIAGEKVRDIRRLFSTLICLFGFLYNYIEKNYKDDEIVISLLRIMDRVFGSKW